MKLTGPRTPAKDYEYTINPLLHSNPNGLNKEELRADEDGVESSLLFSLPLPVALLKRLDSDRGLVLLLLADRSI